MTVTTDRAPGAVMLDPAMVLAVGVLALNDHWLGDRFGSQPVVGVVTGKVSDVAGLAFFPALLASVLEVARWALRRDGWACRPRELVAAMAVTATGFAAVQSLPVAAAAYEAAIAALRWCPAAVAAVTGGGRLPPLGEVGHVMDATDSLCLPAVWASYRAAARAGWRAGAPTAATTEGARVGT
ncbi:MAG TPA: hypothetical protein VFW63_04710 [Acidimicrobiales bacterium]|nr:hypothetical protein [Acidimicrobiales bacterium]